MKRQTKEFKAVGFFTLGTKRVIAFIDTFKVNSPKQAQQRFLTKYGAVLVGAWEIEIKNTENKTVLLFENTNQKELLIRKNPTSATVPTQNTQHGKEAQKIINQLYSDGKEPHKNNKPLKYLYRDKAGQVQSWTGRGRRPKWLEAYKMGGGKMEDIELVF